MDTSSNPPRTPYKACAVPGCPLPEGHTHTAAEWGRVSSPDEVYEVIRAALDDHWWVAAEAHCKCGWKRPRDWTLSHNDHLARIAADALKEAGHA